jgi:hypothetical protein
MRTAILLLFVLLLQVDTANAQVPSSCVASPQLIHAYSDDVKDLAVKRMYDLNSPDTVFIKIPQRYQDTIMEGLAAICNTGAILQADSVFRAHCIHLFPNGNINTSFYVEVDTSYAWTHWWWGLHIATGNPAVDSLTIRNGFTVTHYYPGPGALSNVAVISTTQAVNTRAFADSLAMISGVRRVEVYGVVGGGYNYISYATVATNRIYTFSLRWADCMSGCQNDKNWAYMVDNSCNVSLTSVNTNLSVPYPEPVPLNCNLIPLNIPRVITEPAIDAYPNPCTNVLHVSMGQAQQCTYSLTDSYGRVVSAGTITTGAATINTVSLPSGIYVLRMLQADGVSVYKKVVKE